jgi:O-antigen ligase
MMIGVVVLLYVLLYAAPDTYFIERIRQAVPRFENGELVIHRGSNVYGRLDYWAAALEMFTSSPLVGKGFYSYSELSSLFFPDRIPHAHNSYMQTLAELGLIGAVALGWLMMNIVWYLHRSRRYFKPQEPGRLWWEFVVGSLLFLAFTMLFSNTFWSPSYVAFRMIGLGILVSLVEEKMR